MAFIAFPDVDFFFINLWRGASRVELEFEMRGNLRWQRRAAVYQRITFKAHDTLLYGKAAPLRLRLPELKREGVAEAFVSAF